MTEEEQATLAYLKLHEDAKKLIREIVLDLLMGQEEPMADIVQSEIINIIRSAIEDKPLQFDKDTHPYQRPQFKLQEAILKLVHPHRS
jgi:hypothetical protein